MKIALAAIGRRDLALNLLHYAYELVTLPGFKMSSRRGRYVELDRIVNEAVERARLEVLKRDPDLCDDDVHRISMMVGVGAIRYAMLSISANKRMTFTWDRVLDFEQNSAPFIQYAYARACNILAKVDFDFDDYDPNLLEEASERKLILLLSKFPEVVEEAAETLHVEMICDHLNELATAFNYFYDTIHVMRSRPEILRNTRLQLVNSVRVVLKNGLTLLGIDAPKRM